MSQVSEMSGAKVASPYVNESRMPDLGRRPAHVRLGYERLRTELADDTRVLAGLRAACRASDARWLAELEARVLHNTQVLQGLGEGHDLPT